MKKKRKLIGKYMSSNALHLDAAGKHILPPGWHTENDPCSTIQVECAPRVLAPTFVGPLITIIDSQSGRSSLALLIRRIGDDPKLDAWDNRGQNYLRYAKNDDRVLECVIAAEPPFRLIARMKRLHEQTRLKNPALGEFVPPADRDGFLRMGCPLSPLIGRSGITVAIRLAGPHISLFVDGVLADEEWPAGPFQPGKEIQIDSSVKSVKINPEVLTDDQIFSCCGPVLSQPGLTPPRQSGARDSTQTIFGPERPLGQYWMPVSHNEWVGDVMLTADGEQLHLFWLTSRHRRQQGGLGGGDHPFAHASTHDLKNWQTHPSPYPVTNYWDYIGTGCVVVRNTVHHLFANVLTEHIGRNDVHPHCQHLATSSDHIHYEKQGPVNLPGEPGIVCDDQGVFHAVSNSQHPDGAYRSSHYESDDLHTWKMTVRDFLPEAGWPPSRTVFSNECFNWFRMGAWWYIIGGRTGFWRSQNLMGPYASVNDKGGPLWDIYDGLMVPQTTVWKGRGIMAGWVGFDDGVAFDNVWGGHLVFRELKQRSDGELELVRPAELEPPMPGICEKVITIDANSGPRSVNLEPGRNISRLVCRVSGSGAGRLGLRFTETPGMPVLGELRFDPALCTAQWGTVGSVGTAPEAREMGWKGHDFSIQNVEGLEKSFELDVVIYADTKNDTVLLDAMIDKRRTMISRRLGKVVQSIQIFAEGCRLEVCDLRY